MKRIDEQSAGGIILLYHRVARLETDPQLLAVTPAHFAEHLAVINRIATPMRLREMVSAAETGALPSRAVSITFDDGYADNLHLAEPLLRQHGVPATIFATTGHTDTRSEFFWDELDFLLLQPGVLPAELILHWGQSTKRFDLAEASTYSHGQWAQDRNWNVLQPARPGSRQKLYLELCALIHAMPTQQRSDCIRQIREWAGANIAGRESHRMMSSDELRAISNSPVIEIGAHTVTHPQLAAETVDQQNDEIRLSRLALETTLGQPATSFSYPFGTRRDYTSETVAAVAAAGFKMACSNFNGKVESATDRYQLPRFIVRDWDGVEFERRLIEWCAYFSHSRMNL
jgi:peptidoglycan/xylan/chitin deacetylase (PgdA/CDA1 family)